MQHSTLPHTEFDLVCIYRKIEKKLEKGCKYGAEN